MSSSATHTSTGEKVGQALTRELWAQGLTEHEACAGSNMFPRSSSSDTTVSKVHRIHNRAIE